MIHQRDLAAIWEALPGDTQVLEIDGHRTIGYASTYFDTEDLDSYLVAARRWRCRWKVRTRSSATGGAFVEIKTQHRATTVKSRMAAQRGARLPPPEAVFVAATLAGAGIALPQGALRARSR